MYEAGLVSSKQADKCLELLESKKLASPVNIKMRDGQWNTKLEALAFDWANTFPPMKPEERIGEYPVEVWWEKGLPAVRAVKDRKAGWRRVKEWLDSTDVVNGVPKPKLQIIRGACPNLIKQLSNTMAHPRDPEDIDSGTKNDHAIDSFRYGVMWREYPVKCPELADKMPLAEKHIPTWMKQKDNKWL
jgi:hypothetical protein